MTRASRRFNPGGCPRCAWRPWPPNRRCHKRRAHAARAGSRRPHRRLAPFSRRRKAVFTHRPSQVGSMRRHCRLRTWRACHPCRVALPTTYRSHRQCCKAAAPDPRLPTPKCLRRRPNWPNSRLGRVGCFLNSRRLMAPRNTLATPSPRCRRPRIPLDNRPPNGPSCQTRSLTWISAPARCNPVFNARHSHCSPESAKKCRWT